jgi:hypothetical protein
MAAMVVDLAERRSRRVTGDRSRIRVVGRRRGRPRVRLTRRGRVVLVGLLLALAGLAGVLVAPASQAADPIGARPTVVVRSGDTLWSIAARHAPGRDPFATIDEIRRLNDLPDDTIQAGQRLTLPRRR